MEIVDAWGENVKICVLHFHEKRFSTYIRTVLYKSFAEI